MHSRLAELMEYAEKQRAELLAAVEAVPECLRDLTCDPSAWSVANVLEHLHRVESGIIRLLKRGAERARVNGAMEDENGSLLSSLDSFRILDRSYAVSAPEPVMPRGEMGSAAALDALAESRQGLKDAASRASGLALGSVVYAHPLLGSLTLYQWILFVGQHELRHARQIRVISTQLAAGNFAPMRLRR